MSKKSNKYRGGLSRAILRKKAARAFRGYPIATVAYYGPDKTYASKVAAGIVPKENGDVDYMERWFAKGTDVRRDDEINQAILKYINKHAAKSVAMMEDIIGCPHEEGIDYPQGEACPECPYWAGRKRWLEVSESGEGESSEDKVVLGVAWYRREQYDRLLEVSEDRRDLEATYEEWRESAESNLEELQKDGVLIERIDIDVEELLRWCNEQDRPVDGKARAEYTVQKLVRQSKP